MKSQLQRASLAVASLLLVFGVTTAQAAIGTVVGSKHDFSTTGPVAYRGASTQTCIYCHAPHNTTSTTLLWNRAANAVTYTLYNAAISSTMDATVGQPGAVSKLCLSCHDGTVAIDSFGGATGSKMATGSANLGGTALSNDHPIGFPYNDALVTKDPGLRAVSTGVTIGTGNTGTIENKMLFGATGAATVECASCHDVHNSATGTAVEAKLLKITTVSSALCTTCHIK